MDYKIVAVYKEQQLNRENERLKILLYNAIVLIEKDYDSIESLIEELGMTDKEYDEIMN